GGRKQEGPRNESWAPKSNFPATSYSPTRSTAKCLGAEGLNGCFRNGSGCGPAAQVTGRWLVRPLPRRPDGATAVRRALGPRVEGFAPHDHTSGEGVEGENPKKKARVLAARLGAAAAASAPLVRSRWKKR